MINATYSELAPAGAIRAGDVASGSASRGFVGVALSTSRGLYSAVQKFDRHASQYLAELANARNHAARFVDSF